MKKVLAGAVLLGSMAAWADYTLVFEMKDPDDPANVSESIFKYKDDRHGRVDMKVGDGGKKVTTSMLVRGDKAYMISYENGKPTVMDMDEMMKMASMFGGSPEEARSDAGAETSDVEWIRTGKHRTVGGIRGEVWEVRDRKSGERQEMVLTKDRDYVKAMKAYEQMMRRMSKGNESAMEEMFLDIKPGYAPLSMGQYMTLKSMNEKTVPAATFELPKNAAVHKNPFGAMFSSGGGKQTASGTDGRSGLEAACYDRVCCGQVQGDAEVLPKMVAKSAEGYRLEATAKCDFLGLGALLGVDSVEGAMYKKGDKAVTVTLEMDAKDKGNILKTKEASKHGGPAKVTGYRTGFIGDYVYHYGVLQPMNVQELDVIVDGHTVVTISHPVEQGKVPLVRFAKEAVDFDAYASSAGEKPAKKRAEKPAAKAPQEDGEDTTEKINEGVDKAVEMLKSFF